MPRKTPLQAIPSAAQGLPHGIARILIPLRDAVERRLYASRTDRGELVVTRDDLVKLGLASEADIQTLDD